MIQRGNGTPHVSYPSQNRLPATALTAGRLPGRTLHMTIERWIGEHPAACALAAVSLGVTLGWLIKHR